MPPPTQASMFVVLQPYLWPLVVSLVLTLIATPLIRRLAISRKIYDLPDSYLKPHSEPIPYLGGLGIFAGWAGGLAFMLLFAPETSLPSGSRRMLLFILSAGTLMMLTGLIDDLVNLRPRTKLLCELGVAALLIAGGIGDRVFTVFIAWTLKYGWHVPEPVIFGASAILTVFILMGAGNATNLIDGLDGLCSGVTGIITIGFVAIAAHLAAFGFSPPLGDPVRLTVAFALLGACAAFLHYNFNPARVFMGDAGSLLLGFNAAVMLLLFAEKSILRWFLGACMVFSLPVFDTALAIGRRWLNGRPLFEGDRSHFYDQLRDRGLSVRQTVVICYGLAAFLAAVGCLVMFVRTRYALIIFLVVVASAVVAAIRLGMLRKETGGGFEVIAGPPGGAGRATDHRAA